MLLERLPYSGIPEKAFKKDRNPLDKALEKDRTSKNALNKDRKDPS